MAGDYYRTKVSKAQRTLELGLTIDPGFVHKRRIQTVLGQGGMDLIDEMIERLPALADWTREVRIDHIYTKVMLEFCRIHGIKTLDQVLFDQSGNLFCSTLEVAPCPDFYEIDRATSVWVPSFQFGKPVELEYSTESVRSDTLRGRLHKGTTVSMIGLFAHQNEQKIVFDPLIMGFPWLVSEDPRWADKVNWWRPQFFENYLEDFDEFSKVRDQDLPEDFSIMKDVPEIGLKKALAKILVDETTKGWGGETSDHFTTHIHINGRRVNAAVLLKGPARFTPMTITHLGKNGDQIIRLIEDPADVFFVQHCHEITPAVRKLLRYLAVQPGNPRRYCCIDGRESLRLLQAFDLLEFAMTQDTA